MPPAFFALVILERVSLFAQVSLDWDPSVSCFLPLLDDRYAPPRSAFSHGGEGLPFFCPDWPETMILPTLASHVAWDERDMALCPAID
jgi:hypothetical protein